MVKEPNGKKIIQEIKSKVKQDKKEKRMKNLKENQTIKTIVTVVITLISVAALVAAFIGGMHYQKSVSSEVNNQLKEVVSAIEVKASKQ